MSNVITMFNNNSHINALRANGYGDAGFGIHTTPLYYNAESTEGITTNGWRSSKYATYRTDTGEELGVHGESYRAVRPARMIDTCRNILERSDFNLKGIIEDIQTSHNGSRTFVKYTLPEMAYKTGDGDFKGLIIGPRNSDDIKNRIEFFLVKDGRMIKAEEDLPFDIVRNITNVEIELNFNE